MAARHGGRAAAPCVTYDPAIVPLATAGIIGLAIGAERSWRGFPGSLPFHVAPALFGAFIVVRQPGLIALFWFLPLQILMWLVVTATVCMWSAERTPDAQGEFRGSGGLGLSWSLAFLLGVTCAFSAWALVACACAALVAFGLRTPRRVSLTVAVAASAPAAKPGEESGRGETVGGEKPGADLPVVHGDPSGATETAVEAALIESAGLQRRLDRPAA